MAKTVLQMWKERREMSPEDLAELLRAAPALTSRELLSLAKMQAGLGIDALDVGRPGIAVAFFRDAADYAQQAARLGQEQ